jgi:hypothetical protein
MVSINKYNYTIMKHIIRFGINEFIELEYIPNGGGTISSIGLKFDNPDAISEGTTEALAAYNGAIDGLEQLILAQACEGIDVTSDAYNRAVISAIEGINNNLG